MAVRDYNPKAVNAGQPVNLVGNGLSGLAAPKVKFGPYEAAETTVRNDQHIQARVPAVADGTYAVVLEYGPSNSRTQEFEGTIAVGDVPLDVTVTDFFPQTLPAAGGDLSLFGYHFNDHATGTGPFSIVFHSYNPRGGGFLATVPGTNAQVVNDTMMTVAAPSAGSLNLTATNDKVFQIDVNFPDGATVVFSGGPKYTV